MNIAKYMEAARGPANVAAKGTIRSAPGPGGIRASIGRQAMTPGAPNVDKSPIRGSLEGLDQGKSAWIQMDGSGYGRRPHPSPVSKGSPIRPYKPNIPPRPLISNYTRPKYHGVTRDQDLSRLV